MAVKQQLRRSDLIEPQMSYKIVGVVLDVFHELGPGLKEAVYQKAISQTFRKQNIPFRQQVYSPIMYQGSRVGQRYLDFCIAEKIILELKVGGYFPRSNIQQVKEYLQITHLQLAILAVISYSGVLFKRIVSIAS